MISCAWLIYWHVNWIMFWCLHGLPFSLRATNFESWDIGTWPQWKRNVQVPSMLKWTSRSKLCKISPAMNWTYGHDYEWVGYIECKTALCEIRECRMILHICTHAFGIYVQCKACWVEQKLRRLQKFPILFWLCIMIQLFSSLIASTHERLVLMRPPIAESSAQLHIITT